MNQGDQKSPEMQIMRDGTKGNAAYPHSVLAQTTAGQKKAD